MSAPAEPPARLPYGSPLAARDHSAAGTVFRRVRPWGGEPVDLYAVDGRFSEGPVPADAEVVEGHGLLALPTLVNAHAHPDKTEWGLPWHSRRPAAGLRELIDADATARAELPATTVGRATALLTHCFERGTRAMRAHVDVAPVHGLDGLHQVREAAARFAGVMDLELVAFPQTGLLSSPGTAELLAEAVREGLAEVVGGIDPLGIDGDLPGQLDLVFGLAEKHGPRVDIHLHDRGEEGMRQVREIVARTRAGSLGGRVTISHAFALASLDDDAACRVGDELREAGVALTTVGGNAVLPFHRMRAQGVLVGVGTDGVRDRWSPFGNGDMLERAEQLARRTGSRLDEQLTGCFDAVAHDGARLLGLERADLTPGSPADFMLVTGECVPQVVVDRPPRRLVVRGGRVVHGG
ncbi:amidohydrolase [Streptomyces sp. SM14]|uniref:amidohydrolase n=1 Tax=Streptomyces sp. SM14 TaxID=1736045 RepID=UPI002155FD81|nr:amidohydrolase [Streptomyces sp. SM14]